MRGTMELRQSQAAGQEGPGGLASHFGVGHLVVRSGGVIYVTRCGMVVVELRNHTTCTQEIPVTYRGRDAYVEPLSLVIQRSATPVRCRRRTPPRWRIGKKWFCGYPEIRPCNGPGPLPGHHRTNSPGSKGSVRTRPRRKGECGLTRGKRGQRLNPRKSREASCGHQQMLAGGLCRSRISAGNRRRRNDEC
jgi:hypothetical protein